MATLEHVEKLRERANVTYEEAKEALEHTNDDLLDAMIWLEGKGKVAPPAGGGSYSSQNAPQDTPPPASDFKAEPKGESFSEMMKRFFRFCGKLLNKGNTNSFEVWKKGEFYFSMPITVLVILLLFFWITVPLAIIGLFFGFRYRFSGNDFASGGGTVNRAMDGAASAAEALKEELRAKEAAHREESKRSGSDE